MGHQILRVFPVMCKTFIVTAASVTPPASTVITSLTRHQEKSETLLK